MNDRRVLTAADENAITITAEFYEDGRKLNTGSSKIHRYELDLIVMDDITLDQLLNGVRQGIREKLLQLYQLDPEEMGSNPAYDNMLQRYEQMKLEAKRRFRDQEEIPILETAGYKPPRRKRKTAETAPPEDTKLSAEKDELYFWMVAWNVFHTCTEMYRKGYPERPCTKIRKSFHLKEYPPHPVVACGSIALKNWEDGAFLSMARNSQIWLDQAHHGEKTLRELGFATSSRVIFDPIAHHSAGALFESRKMEVHVGKQVPFYEISDRADILDLPETVKILGPEPLQNPQQTKRRHFLLAASGWLALVAAFTAIMLLLNPESSYALPLTAAWAAVCTVPAVLLYYALRDRAYSRWRIGYEEYIRDLLRSIRKLQQADAQLMLETYEPVYDPATGDDLLERTIQVSKCIFSRRRDHKDFLQVRLGLSCEGSQLTESKIPLIPVSPEQRFNHCRYQNIRGLRGKPFRVLLPQEPNPQKFDYDGTFGQLNDLPQALAAHYKWLDHVPVLLDLHRERLQTFWYEDASKSFLPLLQNLILDICVHHAPEDVQLVLFCPELGSIRDEQNFIRMFKHLPHFQQLLEDRSAFVFSDTQAQTVLDRLQKIRYEREKAPDRAPGPHIVLLVLEEYGLRQHPLSELLPDGRQQPADNGFSFLFFTYFASRIPPYSSRVIKRTQENEWFCVPHCMENPKIDRIAGLRDERRYRFLADASFPLTEAERNGEKQTRMHQAFRVLSALYHSHMDRSTLPASCDLLRLLEEWSRAQELNTRAVILKPDGIRSHEPNPEYVQECWQRNSAASVFRVPIGIGRSGAVSLALNDTAHGRHLLIAGDHDAGKTQSLETVAISHCLHFRPSQVQLILADVTEHGLIAQLHRQPHVKQSLHCGEADPAACCSQLLDLLEKEKNRRMNRLILHGAPNIQSYNRRYPDSETQRDHIIPEWLIILDSWEKWHHLIPDQEVRQSLTHRLLNWMKDAARYGMHLILAANLEESPLSAEMLEQFSLRLCLKMSQKELSQLVTGSSFAASSKMPADGRAYLYDTQTGTTEYLQMASIETSQSRERADAPLITHMDHRGRYKPLCSGYVPTAWSMPEPLLPQKPAQPPRENAHDEKLDHMVEETLQHVSGQSAPSPQEQPPFQRTPDRVLPEFASRMGLDAPQKRPADWVDPRFMPEDFDTQATR